MDYGNHGQGKLGAHPHRRPKKRLTSVAVFFRNNMAGGLGFLLSEGSADPYQLDREVSELLDIYERGYATEADKAAFARDAIEQLEAIGQLPEAERHEHRSIVIGNVYVLTKHGHIADDEYNGVVFNYALT